MRWRQRVSDERSKASCAGRTPRRRTAGNRGSPPSARTAPRPRDCACALRIASPAISRVGSGGWPDRRRKPRRTSSPESASRSPGRASPSGWARLRIWSSRARNRSAGHRPVVPWVASNHPSSSRRRQGITAKRSIQFARKQADSCRIPANPMTCRSAKTPQKSGQPGYFTDDFSSVLLRAVGLVLPLPNFAWKR